MKLRRTIAALSSLVLAGSLVACSSDNDSDSDTIRIGATDSTNLAWTAWVDLAEENGIDIEVVNFSDYNTPNEALTQGKIDANLFQHLKFLAAYNVGSTTDLTPVGSTEIVPLSLYWQDHDSIDGIDGEEVAIPNDETNQGRALLMLNDAGLIEFLSDDVDTPGIPDIDTENSRVQVTPIDASQTVISYEEGRPAVINNTFSQRSGIDPTTAIYADDPEAEYAEPYINVLVTTADNADNEDLQTLVELWHSPEVQAAVEEDSQGTSVAVDRPQSELQEILDRLEAEIS